jgi:chorismate mutase/prephenate dehydratase
MELNELRDRVDQINDQMLQLFLERMECAEQIASYKADHHLPILNRQRERTILSDMAEKAGDKERYAYQLFSKLLELSRARQAEVLQADTQIGVQIQKLLASEEACFPQTGRVACSGVEGGNSQVACDRLFPRGNLVFVKNFEAVFQAVDAGLCEYGVVPIENSSNGSIRSVYELLQSHPFTVVRSTRLCIRHELLALPGVEMKDIREVYSHEQALGQCSHFLNKLDNVRIIPCENTAEAAKSIAESGNRHAAAIAAHSCAELYGLHCMNDAIQDNANNYTRFICIRKKPTLYAGSNHVSLIISCENRPGELYEVLARFAALGLNMTKLESCPVSGSNFEFFFFVDIEANLHDKSVVAMLEDLERNCKSVQLLGNYSEA